MNVDEDVLPMFFQLHSAYEMTGYIDALPGMYCEVSTLRSQL